MARRERRPLRAVGDPEGSAATREDEAAAATAQHDLREASGLAEQYLAAAARQAHDFLVESGHDAGSMGEDNLATARDVAHEVLTTAEETAVELLATARKVAVARLASEELLRVVLDTSRDTVIRMGLDGRVEYVNRRVVEISGIPLEQWIGKTFEETGYPAELAQTWDAHRRLAFATAEPVTYEFEIENADGHRWYETTVAPEIGPDGTVAHVIETGRDITDRKEAQAALEASRALLEQAQRIAHVGSWTLDLATGEVSRSHELHRMQGANPAGPELDYSESGRLFTPESWLRFTTATSHIQETGVPYELELEMVRPDGSHGWMLARGEAVRDEAGAIVGVTGVALDITERKAASDELQMLATHDPLTGLANRAVLLDEITRALSVGRRSGRTAAVLMMDLDRFKDVNDTLGHTAGDDLLIAAAARIETVMRAGDLVARPRCAWWRRSAPRSPSWGPNCSRRRASGWRSRPSRPGPRTWSGRPTPRCMPRRRRAATGSRCSTRTCGPRSPPACRSRMTCAVHSNAANSRCGTSPKWTCGPGR